MTLMTSSRYCYRLSLIHTSSSGVVTQSNRWDVTNPWCHSNPLTTNNPAAQPYHFLIGSYVDYLLYVCQNLIFWQDYISIVVAAPIELAKDSLVSVAANSSTFFSPSDRLGLSTPPPGDPITPGAMSSGQAHFNFATPTNKETSQHGTISLISAQYL